MLLTATVEINAPQTIVWSCIDEPDKIVRWVEGALEHQYLSERNEENPIGQQFRQKLQQGKKEIEFIGTLIEFDSHRHFAFQIPSPAYSSEVHFKLTPITEKSTRVDYSIDITLHTKKAKIAAFFLRLPLSFFIPKQMRRLKKLAESLVTEVHHA